MRAGASEATGSKQEVFLRVDGDGVTQVVGLTEHAAPDAATLLDLLHAAVAQRECSATGANASSSRSHAVYVLHLPSGGQLMLLDLAGSEGSQESLFHSKQQTLEAKEIMNSLAVLRACLRARCEGVAGHVPYRESVLTRVLRGALTHPAAYTALLACVSPACTHLEHTLRTLNTALRLTGGDDSGRTLEEAVVQMPSVRLKGPKVWDHPTLAGWLLEQPCGEKVTLPSTLDGKAIMKLPAPRLRPFCGGDSALAQELFAALRAEARAASKRDLAMRKQLWKNKEQTQAAGFAKGAPEVPVVDDGQ